MSSLDRETPALLRHETPSVAVREASEGEPANGNATAYVHTWPDGDPHVFARALARLLVRRALQEAGAISADQSFALAG